MYLLLYLIIKTYDNSKERTILLHLKLENYLNEYFPEMLSDKSFIMARSDEALTPYCEAVVQDFSYSEVETMVSEVLH